MKKLAVVSLSSVCLLSLLHPVAAAELPRRPVPEGLGVNIHFTDPLPGEMEMIAQVGVRWVRMDFAWDATERTKGIYDFAAYDRLLTSLEGHRIRAVLILDYTNPLYDGNLSPSSDKGRAAFANWAAAAARRFRNHGVLWEMYNEPNSDFWKPKSDVQQYIKLALAVGQALREAAPNELYVGPATSGIDMKFLEECFKAGLLKYWSGVTVHPYRQNAPETVAPEYAHLRQLIDRYKPKGKSIPILSGEWGFSSVWANFDETKQGKMLPRQWLTNLANGVPLSIWYDWHDDGLDPKNPEHHFGMVHNAYLSGQKPVYQPKPAYVAAQTLIRILSGYCFQKRLPVGGPDDYVLQFTKGKQVCLVAWTVDPAPHTVVLPVPLGRYAAKGHLGEVLPALAADAKGLSVALTDAPTYLISQ